MIPLLVEYCGSWCVPSQAMYPILKRLQREYKGRALIEIVNVDRNPAARIAANIQACPTFVLYREGREIERRTGALSEEQLREMIDA